MKNIVRLTYFVAVFTILFTFQSCQKDPINTTPSYKATANWQLNSMVETIYEASTGKFVESNDEIYAPGELSMHINDNGILDLYEGETILESHPYSLNYDKKFIVIHGMDWGNDTFNIVKLDATNLQLIITYIDVDYDEKVTTQLNMTKK